MYDPRGDADVETAAKQQEKVPTLQKAPNQSMTLNKSHVEEAALEWFGKLGYAVGHRPQIAPGEPSAERNSFANLVLVGCLRDAIQRPNPSIPDEARDEALRTVLRLATTSLVQTGSLVRGLRVTAPARRPHDTQHYSFPAIHQHT